LEKGGEGGLEKANKDRKSPLTPLC